MNPLLSNIDGATTQSLCFEKSTFLLEVAKIRILCRYSWGSMFCRYLASLPVVDADVTILPLLLVSALLNQLS